MPTRIAPRRLLPPLILGLAGGAVLVSLGLWQLRRLDWKEGVLAQISARIDAPAVDLPVTPRPPGTDRIADPGDLYLPVQVSGHLTGAGIDVLASTRNDGPGVRAIAVLETPQGRRILVDRGFLPEPLRHEPRPPKDVQITGNLNWPDEVDGYTPAPDRAAGLWFARDVPAMAAELGTEPVLVVARSDTGDAIRPLPVDTAGIPNDHLAYAIQWFGLAAVWAGMTGLLLWRITRRKI